MIKVLTKDIYKEAFKDGHLGGPGLFIEKLIKSCAKQGIAQFTFDPNDSYDAILDGTIKMQRTFTMDEVAGFRKQGKPFVLRLNGSGPKSHRDTYVKDACGIIGKASHIIYQSMYCKTAWVGSCGGSVVDETPSTIIMNGDDPERFNVAPLFDKLPGVTFAAVASWGPQKKIEFIVDLFKSLIREGADVSLLLGGRFKYGEAVPTIEKQFEDRIVFSGFVNPSDIPAFYKSADAFIHARAGDWCPNSVVEALCAGLPGVVHSKGGTTELLGEAGVTFDEHDLAEASQAVAKLIDNYDHYRSKVADRVALLNIDSVAQRYIAVMKQELERSEYSVTT